MSDYDHTLTTHELVLKSYRILKDSDVGRFKRFHEKLAGFALRPANTGESAAEYRNYVMEIIIPVLNESHDLLCAVAKQK